MTDWRDTVKTQQELYDEVAELKSKLMDGKSHICAIQHEHRGCAWCRAEEAESKLSAVSKLLDDWADAERQGLGVPILAGIGQIREALK